MRSRDKIRTEAIYNFTIYYLRLMYHLAIVLFTAMPVSPLFGRGLGEAPKTKAERTANDAPRTGR